MVAKYENGNTIKISLSFNDLEEHNIKLVDFLSDQGKVEHLFYELVDELDLSDYWEDPTLMTFQIRPHAEGVDILVTDDIEELSDQTYDDMAVGLEDFLKTVSDDSAHDLPSQLEARKIKASMQAARMEKAESEEKVKDVPSSSVDKGDHVEEEKEPDFLYYTLSFPNVTSAIKLAKTVILEPDESELYDYNGRIYLTVLDNQKEKGKRMIMSYRSLMLEYGEQGFASRETLREHGKLILSGKALQILNEL